MWSSTSIDIYTKAQLITYNRITEKPIKLYKRNINNIFAFSFLGIESWNGVGPIVGTEFFPVIGRDILILCTCIYTYIIPCNYKDDVA